MVQIANIPRSERAAALTAVIVLHVLLLALFLATRSSMPPPAITPGSMTVVSLADDSAATPPPPLKMPSKVPDDLVQLAELALSTETDPSASTASASGCTALEAVTKALLSDPVAVAAVLQAPPETRSIAEAIVVWNVGWTPATATLGAPLEPVRTRVRESLQSIDAACLDEPIAGPRLIPVPAGGGTMFLVIGSGNWSWRQLTVDPDPMLQLSPPGTAGTPSAPSIASMSRPWN